MKNNPPQPLIIKKYENRRLYNTLTSQYINQDQVAQLVRDGYDVRVVDAASGEDITRLILAQIVLEDAKTPDSGFPLDVLRQMIVASGRATQESTLRYMKAMMDMYQNAYRALPSPMTPFEFLPGWGQTHGKEDLPPAPAKPARKARENGTAADDSVQEQGSEVSELRRRVEELEAALAGRKPGRKTKKAKSRRKS
ncbi:MAG: polyhydroxyalkanoate synthesis regulator DNA-binding domain-containing protein [Candidatus Korobacteraceae bacterium]